MPPKPRWFKRIPEIAAAVERSPAPFLDRASVEKLFGLGRRQALKLVHALGSHQVGNALVVPRDRLLAYLDAIRRGKEFAVEMRRIERIRDVLEESRQEVTARAVRFKVAPAGRTIADLPASIRIAPGELHVSFAGLDDLLRQLFQLSRAIAGDLRKFEALIREEVGR